MQSLKSRGYVTEQFAWRHYYWYLTNEGIQYLRDYLHLPPEIVPATLKPKRTESNRPRPAVARPEPSKLSEDRQAYRRAAPMGGDKKADVGPGANPNLEFVSDPSTAPPVHLTIFLSSHCREEDMVAAVVQRLSNCVPPFEEGINKRLLKQNLVRKSFRRSKVLFAH